MKRKTGRWRTVKSKSGKPFSKKDCTEVDLFTAMNRAAKRGRNDRARSNFENGNAVNDTAR